MEIRVGCPNCGTYWLEELGGPLHVNGITASCDKCGVAFFHELEGEWREEC